MPSVIVIDTLSKDGLDLLEEAIVLRVSGILRIADDQSFGGDANHGVRPSSRHEEESGFQLTSRHDVVRCAAPSGSAASPALPRLGNNGLDEYVLAISQSAATISGGRRTSIVRCFHAWS